MSQIRRIERSDGTVVLSVRDGWCIEVENAVAAGDYDCLTIAAGVWENFDWLLPYVDNIRKLDVTSPVTSYGGIEKLVNLVELSLDDTPGKLLDFKPLQKLRKIHLQWDKRYQKDVFDLPELREITLVGYSGINCLDIACAQALLKLDLRQAKLQTLQGLQSLSSLTHLSLAYLRNLSDVSTASSLTNLTTFHIEKCPKVIDINCVKNMVHLKHLFIDCGSIGFNDLKWLEQFHELTDVLISISVREINWDIIFSLHNLQRVVINTHPGYAITDQELATLAKNNNREITNYIRAGTKIFPAFKFWLEKL